MLLVSREPSAPPRAEQRSGGRPFSAAPGDPSRTASPSPRSRSPERPHLEPDSAGRESWREPQNLLLQPNAASPEGG